MNSSRDEGHHSGGAWFLLLGCNSSPVYWVSCGALLHPTVVRGAGTEEDNLDREKACYLCEVVGMPGGPGWGGPVGEAALGCALLHTGNNQQAGGWSSWVAFVVPTCGHHGAGPGTPHLWGDLGTERTSSAGGVGRSCVTLGSCSASIYSSSPGEGHFPLIWNLPSMGHQHWPSHLTNMVLAKRLGPD